MKTLSQKLVLRVFAIALIACSSLSFSETKGCPSIPGTASATLDSICSNGTTTLLLTGHDGNIQWQSFNGTIWVDEVGIGSTTANYTVTLSASTEFRAIVTKPTCPPDTSNVQLVTVGVMAPVTNGDTRCGYGPVTLTASGGGIFKWYDSPSSTTPLFIGSAFTTNVANTTTFYCAAASNSGGTATTPLPPQSNTFSSLARGYFFTAPSDFTITGAFIPEPVNGNTQNIAIVRFDPPVAPPVFGATTNDFITLFLTQNNPSVGVIPVNIPISAGDVIGVLGTRGTNDVNSYAPGPYNTTIDGQSVAIARMGMQFSLANNTPQQIWQEIGASISRVELTYEVGCESPRTATIATVTTPPPMTLAATPSALCQGQSSVLSVASNNLGYSYTWSPATGLSGTTGASVTATPLTPITYTLVANDGTCGNIDSLFISVGPASVAGTATISTDTICLGSTATLSLAGNTGSIQWQSYDGVNWNNETGTGSTTNQYEVSPLSNSQFRALVTSGGCASATTGTLNLAVIAVTDPATVNDTICGPGTVTLLSTGAGVMNWFTTPTGGASIHAGNIYMPLIFGTTTYYVEASAGGTYNIGAPNAGIGTQFPLGGNDWGLQFDVTQEVTLEKVYISPGASSGNVVINLRASQGGPILNTVTKAVTSFSGLQPVNLGFTISPGTGYRLEMDASSVQCYYNSFGASYPYTIPGSSVTITGYVNPAFASGVFYYFFYNWEITEGCKSNRVPVTGVIVNSAPVPTPTIVQNGTILTSSSSTGNQWYLNGSPIPGATGQTFDLSNSGSGTYTVVVTDPATGCHAQSSPLVYTGISENLAAAGIWVYPNPVSDNITIEFKKPLNSSVMVSVYNKLGELVSKKIIYENKNVIPMDFAPGVYSIELNTGEGIFSTRILKL